MSFHPRLFTNDPKTGSVSSILCVFFVVGSPELEVPPFKFKIDLNSQNTPMSHPLPYLQSRFSTQPRRPIRTVLTVSTLVPSPARLDLSFLSRPTPVWDLLRLKSSVRPLVFGRYFPSFWSSFTLPTFGSFLYQSLLLKLSQFMIIPS